MTKYKLPVQTIQTVEVDEEHVGHILLAIVAERTGIDDDDGLDWLTSEDGERTYLGGQDYLVSTDPQIAMMVNVANSLVFDGEMHVYEEEEEEAPTYA